MRTRVRGSILLCVLAAADATAAALPPRTDVLLNGMWEVRRSADASTWAPVRVPEALTVREPRRPVWYRLRFPLPNGARRERRAILVFEKAGHRVRVELNGRPVGEHWGARLPFSFDVTDLLREAGDNELAVWAAPADAANARPGGVASADAAKAYDVFRVGSPAGWYPAGIFGDVVLRLVPAVRIEDVFVRTSFRRKAIDATLEVANPGPGTAKVRVRTEVVSLDGTPTAVRMPDETLTVPPAGRASVERSAAFPGALPWPDGGGGTPPLYVLRASLLVDGRTDDLVTQRFGFREVWTEGRDLVLNGRRLRVAGDILTAFTERQRLAHLFAALRSVGVNLVHPHWDDPTRSFYDLADEAGMLVMPSLYCAGPLALTRPVVADAAWAGDMGRQYEAWVRFRRNHPSIVLWSPYDFLPVPGVRPADLEGFDRIVRTADGTRPILGPDVLETAIGDPHRFLVDAGHPHRTGYERQLARSRDLPRPLMVCEIAQLGQATRDDLQALIERFAHDAVAGWIGLRLEDALFRPRTFTVSWPSASGHDGRPMPPRNELADVVNWSDAALPATVPTAYGELFGRLAPTAHGTPASPLAFVRGPELLVVGPARCGGRGYALAAPLSGAGGVERATLLDPQGKGWLLLTEPGRYRVRIACDGERATTIEAKGRPFSHVPGFGHLQEVRLDAAP